MNIPWNEMRAREVRDLARREAMDVTKVTFRALCERLDRHITVGYRMDTKRALQIVRGEFEKIVNDIQAEQDRVAKEADET